MMKFKSICFNKSSFMHVETVAEAEAEAEAVMMMVDLRQ
jgi:hypothetical protein